MKTQGPTEIKSSKRKRFEHQFLLISIILFLIFNWEILLVLTGVNESLSARVEFIRNLHLGWLNFLAPALGALIYMIFNPKLQYFLDSSQKKQPPVVNTSELEKAVQLLFGTYSEIGIAGKNVIDETLIYSTAQENFLKKNSLSAEEVIWAREELCLKYQDSLKKVQELMIVLAMQNQEKVLAMHQRLKDEKRI